MSSGIASSQHLAEKGNFRLGQVNIASSKRGAPPGTSRQEDLGIPEDSMAPKRPENGKPFTRSLRVPSVSASKAKPKL